MAQPWWRGAVIYQVYPRSFLDTNGDGVGDLPGITRNLDHIAGLGVDAVWISPFFPSPMKDFGYDVSDYCGVDPLFGTLADFDALTARAHALGLKVVIDMVLAHSSDAHPWFAESRRSRDNPKADWYVWADPKRDGTPPNNWLSMFGGPAWQWEPQREQYFLHHFLRSQPNLNWHSPGLVEAMMGQVRFWLDRGVDGLRLDAITTLVNDPDLRDNPPRASYAPKMLQPGTTSNPILWQEHLFDRDQPGILPILARLRGVLDEYPDRYMIGEVGDVDPILVGAKYTAGTDRLHSFYSFQFSNPDFGIDRLSGVVRRIEQHLGTGWATHSLGNHDSERVVSRWGRLPDLAGDPAALAKMAMALVMTLRGGACLYQGEELGLTEADVPFEQIQDPFGLEFWPEFKGRDGCRTPMPWQAAAPHAGFSTAEPWLPIPPEHRALAIDRQEADPDSVLRVTRAFLQWRRRQPPLVTGRFRLLESTAPVFAFEREEDGASILCAFNLSNRPATAAIGTEWRPLDAPGFAGRVEDGTLHLPAFGAFFAAG